MSCFLPKSLDEDSLPFQRRSSRARLAAIALSAWLALTIAGCVAHTPVVATPVSGDSELPRGVVTDYKLVSGDLLAIKFYNNPELDDEQRVRPDGKISLPFIGQVDARGLSPGELEDELERRYTGELASPQVTVIVREFAPERIYVGGEVAEQGAYPIHGPLTLAQAIQEAGGFLTTARRQQVLLIRSDAGGEPRGFAVDLTRVLSGEAPGADVYLRAQDIVFVPRTRITNVGLFIQQYVRDVLPIQPGFSIPVGGNNNQ